MPVDTVALGTCRAGTNLPLDDPDLRPTISGERTEGRRRAHAPSGVASPVRRTHPASFRCSGSFDEPIGEDWYRHQGLRHADQPLPDMFIREYVIFYDPSTNRRVGVPVCVPAADGEERAEPSEDRGSGSSLKAAVAQAIVRDGAAMQILTDAEISRNTEAHNAAHRHFAGREAELWALLDRIPWRDA